MPRSVTRTLRLKVRAESYPWLLAAAVEVNQVYNYCNEISFNTARRTDRLRRWLSGFDLCSLTAGSCVYFEHIRERERAVFKRTAEPSIEPMRGAGNRVARGGMRTGS